MGCVILVSAKCVVALGYGYALYNVSGLVIHYLMMRLTSLRYMLLAIPTDPVNF